MVTMRLHLPCTPIVLTLSALVCLALPDLSHTGNHGGKPPPHAGTHWDVAFFWSPQLHHALDYQEEIEGALGREIGRQLRVVKGPSGMFGIVHPINRNRKDAAKQAETLSEDLYEAGLPPASVVKHSAYLELFNVVYDKSRDLELQKRNYRTVTKLLGMKVAKKLVIEKTRDAKFALVYRSIGDRSTSQSLAKIHSAALHRKLRGSFSASLERSGNNWPVYGESSYIDDILSGKAKAAALAHDGFLPAKSDTLEKRIRNFIQMLKSDGKIGPDERTSWSVIDFRNGETLVSINEALPRQTASMVKPLVALAFFHGVEKGEFTYGRAFKTHMERMIQGSDNVSTNWIMSKLGGPAEINRILKENYGHIFLDLRITGYIPLTERERKNARKMGMKRVPAGTSYYENWASALDYSRFLYGLWKDRLPFARELKRLMALPNRDRVYHGARKIPKGTLVYDKTGTTARLCGDMAILAAEGINGHRFAYTLVGIIEKETSAPDYITWKNRRGDIIREVSNLVYTYQKQRHGLL